MDILDSDEYKTIESHFGDVIYKEKGSKFVGYVFLITSEDDVKQKLKELKEVHYSARHFCYAWKIGIKKPVFRANDDGEPKNSAGQPIFGQIVSKNVTNVLVVVVRYFGGTKLGVGGLITAYKTTAKMILEESKIVKKTINISFSLIFEYKDMDKVMRIIKQHNLNIIEQKMELNCDIQISVREKQASRIKKLFLETRSVEIAEI